MICTKIKNVESMQRNCNNSDLDQETDERIVVYLPMVDFVNLAQDFSMSDLPPSYDSCVLETQPPSYSSTILIHHQWIHSIYVTTVIDVLLLNFVKSYPTLE